MSLPRALVRSKKMHHLSPLSGIEPRRERIALETLRQRKAEGKEGLDLLSRRARRVLDAMGIKSKEDARPFSDLAFRSHRNSGPKTAAELMVWRVLDEIEETGKTMSRP